MPGQVEVVVKMDDDEFAALVELSRQMKDKTPADTLKYFMFLNLKVFLSGKMERMERTREQCLETIKKS